MLRKNINLPRWGIVEKRQQHSAKVYNKCRPWSRTVRTQSASCSGWCDSERVDAVHQLILGKVSLAGSDLEVCDSQSAIAAAFYLAKQVKKEPAANLYAFTLKGAALFGRVRALRETDFSITHEAQSSQCSIGRVISSRGKVRALHLVADADEGLRSRRRSCTT